MAGFSHCIKVAAAAALLDTESFNRNTVAIKATRDKSCKRLEEMGKQFAARWFHLSESTLTLRASGFEVCPTQSNFMFCIPPMNAETLTNELRENGYLIRYFKIPGISQYVRISVGSDEEMDGFFSAVEEILSKRAQ